jgi:uncharacterized protein (DUF58 family)
MGRKRVIRVRVLIAALPNWEHIVPAFTFNPNDLHRLNRLMYHPQRAALEQTSGSHQNRKAGDGVDFLDFRPYAPGDDFRSIDWNLYGRLRQLFVRLHEAPRQLAVTLLIDVSRSMLFGQPITKLHQAQRIACALGFIGLRNGDRVWSYAFADGQKAKVGPLQGAPALPRLVRFLAEAEAGGESNLLAMATSLRAARRAKGLVVILSDFLNVGRCEEAINMLIAGGSGGGRTLAVQVLDDLDRGVGLDGTLRLQDSETGRMVDVKIDRKSLGEYQRRFEHARQQLEDFCGRRRQAYVLARTTDSYVELVGDVLRTKAVVR